MARTLREATLTTRAARAKLERGIHWRGIDPDVHLGYPTPSSADIAVAARAAFDVADAMVRQRDEPTAGA